MSDEYQKLKDILRSNIKAVKDVTDNLFYVKDKLDATQVTVADLLARVEELEANPSSGVVDGVRAFSATSGSSAATVSQQLQALDLEPEALPALIMQHPSWLRPFSVVAEVEYHQLEQDSFRLLRSKTGYLRVIRLSNGTEWAYFEEMSKERFQRIPLLSKIFADSEENYEFSWVTAWTSTPLRLQTLQRGSRWEVLELGQYVSERGKD